MIFNIMIPGVEIITPIRDMKLSREEEIAYLKKHNVEMNFEKSVYSINKGLWGTSVGGKETLNSNGMLPEEAWPTQVTKSETENVVLEFEKGQLKTVNSKLQTFPYDLSLNLVIVIAMFGLNKPVLAIYPPDIGHS